ncbi:MAG: FAD-binding protein, partial [Clostridiales bacterium]|nr:FAD-binding protein [Clostridiales bacterium]
MNKTKITLAGMDFDVYSLNTVIVGTGAAGYNAADTLHSLGERDIAILTEGINMGTSRNTGSDKQTYYKLTLAGGEEDSVMDMAKTLFAGGAMHGDIALVEAALSAKCFYKLVNIGVPFPHNRYGEYVGYKTDHDPRQRATSCGPLTSKFMTEKLEAQVQAKGIEILDGYLVIGILTEENEKSVGLVALDKSKLDNPNRGLTLFNCTNIIYATGGPAGIYLTSVYPESQIGSSGIAYEAGAKGINLTESQYGIASIDFRWNLSGTYQQVIPRYVSTDKEGKDEREFLEDYFNDPGQMMDAIFLKGYQWPFDPRKVDDYGSSLIDILVYNETQIKGRRVFLDFTKNPSWGSKDGELDFSLLGEESYKYLENSHALFGTPIERLSKMN